MSPHGYPWATCPECGADMPPTPAAADQEPCGSCGGPLGPGGSVRDPLVSTETPGPRGVVASPEYLGDGAYVRLGSYAGEVVLYTSNGVAVTNEVVLGPLEVAGFERWLATLRGA